MKQRKCKLYTKHYSDKIINLTEFVRILREHIIRDSLYVFYDNNFERISHEEDQCFHTINGNVIKIRLSWSFQFYDKQYNKINKL